MGEQLASRTYRIAMDYLTLAGGALPLIVGLGYLSTRRRVSARVDRLEWNTSITIEKWAWVRKQGCMVPPGARNAEEALVQVMKTEMQTVRE
jgi:hypothetical protein